MTSTAVGLSVILVFSVFSYLLAAGIWVRASLNSYVSLPSMTLSFFSHQRTILLITISHMIRCNIKT